VQARIDGWRAAIEQALGTLAAETQGGGAVAEATRYALETGGKRLRPVLCVAAAEAVGADVDLLDPAMLRAATAVELVHTYSLVHDDLPCMDDDDLRRGRPTTHRVHGTLPAMAAGFGLIPAACRVLHEAAGQLGLPPERRLQAVVELCAGAGAAGMVGGQVLDLEAEGLASATAGLERIHAMKTGSLIQAAVRIGGVLGGADPMALAALDAYGAHLGLAFQITDDVLDVTMDADALGKTPGKDQGAGKATFTSLHGVAGARSAAGAEAAAAVAALDAGGIRSPVLEALAGFAVHRDR
jgi:geranylgeranyl diphosphate synthase, type II